MITIRRVELPTFVDQKVGSVFYSINVDKVRVDTALRYNKARTRAKHLRNRG